MNTNKKYYIYVLYKPHMKTNINKFIYAFKHAFNGYKTINIYHSHVYKLDGLYPQEYFYKCYNELDKTVIFKNEYDKPININYDFAISLFNNDYQFICKEY